MNSIKIVISLLVLQVFIASASTNKKSMVNQLQRGVSQELAQYRKANISKIAYSLSLTIPREKAQPIATNEKIAFHLSERNQPVILDFKEQIERISSLKVNGKVAKLDFRNEHIIIPAKLLKKGGNEVEISLFAGDLSLNRKDDFIYTLLVPERARTFFPCFEQPDLKAVFHLNLITPNDWEVISNAKINSCVQNKNTKTTIFYPSDTIPTYLFTMVAGKFKRESRLVENRQMNLYFRESDSLKIAQSIDSIFELHRYSLRFMEKYTQIPYPFQKLDMIAIPDFPFGGMEHVGAIDYRESTLFLTPSSTNKEKVARAQLIAHETAHMWFGNLVTMKWFNDVWMKEVFANFMADKVVESLRPNENAQLQFLLAHHPAAYTVERTEGSNPIRQTLANLDQASTLYGNIIYHKSPIVMNQLEMTIGKNAMQKGLQKYLQSYAFKNADWNDLIHILNKQTGYNLNDWNQQWINKKGRPIISYDMKVENGSIQQFTLTQKAEQNETGIWKQRFQIALVYKDSTQLIYVNMTQPKQILKSIAGRKKPLHVILNATGEGYGLFAFDPESLANDRYTTDELYRASNYINLYENLLAGKDISPTDMVLQYSKQFEYETNIKTVELMSAQFKNIYWQFLKPSEREAISSKIENNLWRAIEKSFLKEKKRVLFQTFASIAISKESVDLLYSIWKNQSSTEELNLNEDDFTNLAAELAIRDYPQYQSILDEQCKRIQNVDRKKRFEFCRPALSNVVAVRDRFFTSLENKEMRKESNWVSLSLSYLHHPLRAKTSEKYIPKSLQLLEEIQATSGIFFPSDWLKATLNYYQTPTAQRMVRQFIASHPLYSPNLKNKILQESDDLFRTQMIFKKRVN